MALRELDPSVCSDCCGDGCFTCAGTGSGFWVADERGHRKFLPNVDGAHEHAVRMRNENGAGRRGPPEIDPEPLPFTEFA